MRDGAVGRRGFVSGILATPLAAAMPPMTGAPPPVVATRHGRVRGAWADGIASFKGVRYGADTAPVRFRAPSAPNTWRGVTDALDYGNQAPQLRIGLADATILQGFAIDRPASEDCLFVNLWTAEPRAGARRPVMVWLHGGGFVAGSGASAPYDGTRLAARHDVVVVTLNHRLGIFGHLWFAPEAGTAFADSGNAGTLDLVLALRWVRDNIAAFGGDPGNVTIFGESGGGCKVSALMATPAAKGLFHKAVVQSGSLIKAHTPATAAPMTRTIMADLGLGEHDAAALARMPYDEIAPKLPVIAGKVGWRLGPVIDGRSLMRHPFEPEAPGESRDVPLLVGANKDESTLIAGLLDPARFTLDEAGLSTRLATLYAGRDIPALVAGLRRVFPFATPSDLYFTAASWTSIRRNATIQAERKAGQGGAAAFSYLLAWETPVEDGKWKTPHALDLPLVFDNVAVSTQMVGPRAEAQQVADAMSAARARFAHTGNPGWAAYDAQTRTTMVFDVSSRVMQDPDRLERALLYGPPVNTLAPGQ